MHKVSNFIPYILFPQRKIISIDSIASPINIECTYSGNPNSLIAERIMETSTVEKSALSYMSSKNTLPLVSVVTIV